MVNFKFRIHRTDNIDDTISYLESYNPQLLKISLFVNITENAELKEFSKKIENLNNADLGFLISIIAMPSADGSFCSFEIFELDNKAVFDISISYSKPISYCTIQDEDCLTLITSFIPNFDHRSSDLNSLYQQAYRSFVELNTILLQENMRFSDIVRQWSYI